VATQLTEIATDQPSGPYVSCNGSLCSRKGPILGAAPRDPLCITRGEALVSGHQWSTREAVRFFFKIYGSLSSSWALP
jgi:hypothetical protein